MMTMITKEGKKSRNCVTRITYSPISCPDNPWDTFPNDNKHHQRDDDEENQTDFTFQSL